MIMNGAKDSPRYLTLLSQALLGRENIGAGPFTQRGTVEPLATVLSGFDRGDFSELWTLATSNHVIMRAFPAFVGVLEESGNDRAEWFDNAMAKEQARIRQALSFLEPICRALEEAGDVIVIKSLDHWPDLGSDLDLYTSAEARDVVAIMRDRFKAQVAERSWGDRLANKWNFVVPALPELVEVHVTRLGQTGEQIAITQSLIARSGMEEFGLRSFRVPALEDRMLISTLQRMYRHFYIRLCDVVDNARLVDSGRVDYRHLKSLAAPAGLWDGLATYLVIISGYVKSYRGEGLALPPRVTKAARFGDEAVRFARNFLRVPIFPQAIRLYASEWTSLLRNGEIGNALRLSLLPGLATAAALELKITGSDKGIW
ncbi:MAG: hypothetical protein WB566_09625 [Terriglobales bacterium]